MNNLEGINQLRAASVLFVFLFHSDILHAGFIGVDIFFVISGFLIGSSIQRLKNKEPSSLKIFYKRRILRLFPALIAVIIITLIVNFIVVNDQSRLFLNRSAIAALLFSSNIYDSIFSDYFATSSAYNPYSHLWSLGIEEQFYIVIAPIMIFLRKNKSLLIAMMSISMLLFIFSTQDTSVLYFFPIYRIWELFAGVILSIFIFDKQFTANKNKLLANNFIILLLILISMFGFQPEFIIFWKIQTLLVVSLSIIFILNCPYKIGFFSLNQMAIWIGNLSYGMYLIHLPIIVYLRWIFGYLDIYMIILSLILSLVLSHLMYKYLESIFWKPSKL